jgi:hypothetical protein
MEIAVFWDVIPRVLIDKYQSSEVREDLIRNKCLA